MVDDPWVLDASVAAKCFFEEDGSRVARELVLSRPDWLAPDLIFLELASVAAKWVRRGVINRDLARDALAALPNLITNVWPCRGLSGRAYEIARDHGVSAYDGAYLALAETAETIVVTADQKLVARAREAGLGRLVRPLIP